MRITIVSDIHANMEGLDAVPGNYDELWVLGDLVNYGPEPAEVIQFVRANASVIVRGNHDHAIGCGEDPRCSAPFREMADVMAEYTNKILSARDKEFLRSLPLSAQGEVDGVRYSLCHAAPSDPLYRYLGPDDPAWAAECEMSPANVLAVGHTHLQFQRTFGPRIVVNPGSVGQCKTGRPLACYATITGKTIALCAREYPVEATVAKIQALPIPARVRGQLSSVLRNGGLVQPS